MRLHPDFDALAREADGCAPLVVTGPELDAVRRRLDRRAEVFYSPTSQAAKG